MTDEGIPKRTGLRVGWVVFTLLVLTLGVSGWFILTERARDPVAGRPTAAPMLGGAGSVDQSLSSTVAPAPSIGRPASPVPPTRIDSVSGVEEVRTITCTGNAVSINGVRNTVTLNGPCSRVDVSGVENTVSVDAAEAISVSGIRNQVRFRSGEPRLDKSGIDNTLERG